MVSRDSKPETKEGREGQKTDSEQQQEGRKGEQRELQGEGKGMFRNTHTPATTIRTRGVRKGETTKGQGSWSNRAQGGSQVS